MGHAILSGIFTRLHTAPEDLPSSFIATVGRESSIPSLRDSFSTDHEISFKFGDEGNLEAIKAADIVLLACKPYMAKTILQKPGVRDALKGKVLASVLAGVTMSQLSEWAGEECEVVRTMTNTPSKVCLFPPPKSSHSHESSADRRRNDTPHTHIKRYYFPTTPSNLLLLRPRPHHPRNQL